jgi:macrolide transport system ATP-binding/permease protein
MSFFVCHLNVMENRLAEIIGRLAMPAKNDDRGALAQEYHAVLAELKNLKALYLCQRR